MGQEISVKQIARFLYTALLMQLAVYFVVGLICKYRFSFSMIQFSYGLSYAGLGFLVIAGIMLVFAKPKTWRPDKDPKTESKTGSNPDEEIEEIQDTLNYNYVSPIKSLFGFTGMMSRDNHSTDKTSTKLTPKQMYYYSGLFFLVGLVTIFTSEVIYRGLL